MMTFVLVHFMFGHLIHNTTSHARYVFEHNADSEKSLNVKTWIKAQTRQRAWLTRPGSFLGLGRALLGDLNGVHQLPLKRRRRFPKDA